MSIFTTPGETGNSNYTDDEAQPHLPVELVSSPPPPDAEAIEGTGDVDPPIGQDPGRATITPPVAELVARSKGRATAKGMGMKVGVKGEGLALILLTVIFGNFLMLLGAAVADYSIWAAIALMVVCDIGILGIVVIIHLFTRKH